jgi:hypothetical protein
VLEHKGIRYHRKTLSFDAGDLKTAEFGALSPRCRVAGWLATISHSPNPRRLSNISRSVGPRDLPFSPAIRSSARSNGAWCVSCRPWPVLGVRRGPEGSAKRRAARVRSMGGRRDRRISNRRPLGGGPHGLCVVALFLRHADRRADSVKDDVIGPRLASWMDRMQRLPIVEPAWPPHWK